MNWPLVRTITCEIVKMHFYRERTKSPTHCTMAQQTVAEKLVYAAGKGYIDDIAALLNQKADVNAKDQLGNTALSMYSPKKNYL
jgi:hypothetical protein